MEILSFLNVKKQKRYVSENDFAANQIRHVKQATESLVSLRDVAVEEEDEFKIDYFFYTDTLEKAQKLEEEIQSMNFIVNHGPASQNKNLFAISGRTLEIKMMHESLSKWVSEMCELGYKHDCNFESWQIVPELNKNS